MKLTGARILLTGASTGIGRATAIALAARGARLALVARDRERLAAACEAVRSAGGEANALPADLGNLLAADRVVERAQQLLGGLDAIVNNAGQNAFGRLQDQQPSALEALFRINVLAPLLLARAALPGFLRQGSGHVVNVGSAFGAIGFPYYAAYSATKFALRGFSEALRREVAPHGVRVTYVAPRATRTRMTAGSGAPAQRMDEPEAVARAIVRAIERDRKECAIGAPERIAARVNRVWPGLFDLILAGEARRLAPHAAAAIDASGQETPADATVPLHSV